MKKTVIAIIGILLLLITILIVVFYTNKQQDIRSRAAPATTLSFSSTSLNKKLGDTFSLDVVVNTGTNTISATDLAVNTDATKVKIAGMTVGSYLPTVLLAESHTDSRATVTLGSPPTSPKKGTGILATVTFQVVGTSGSTQISFTGSQVAGIGEQGNVLSGTTPTTITLNASAGTTTPTRTPTPIPPTQAGGLPTRTPTQTPQSGATQATATHTPTPVVLTQQLSITNPSEGETFKSGTPKFTGTAVSGSPVTITIYGDPNTPVVTADNSGYWQYTPGTSLSDGQHQITVTSLTSDGNTTTLSKSFYVITKEVPVTGAIDFLILPVGIGGLLLLLGFLL